MEKKRSSVKELRKEIAHLRELITHDELTGTLNRRGFFESVSGFFNTALLYKRKEKGGKNKKKTRKKYLIKDLSIIFVDLDGVKKVNDIYGHAAGDLIIQTAARIIKNNIRETDFVARWGGDEFVIATIGADEADAYKIAEKIRVAGKKGKEFSSYEQVRVTFSNGVAELDKNINSPEELIERADNAMYEAKNNRGRNCTVMFSKISLNNNKKNVLSSILKFIKKGVGQADRSII
jgi:diguanylate cyclase (GGDEF)-like protein